MKTTLETLRNKLDEVDSNILKLLTDRVSHIEEIGRLKRGGTERIRDLSREEDILARLAEEARSLNLDVDLVTRVFREILDHSVRRQRDLFRKRSAERGTSIVAYLGEPGSYGFQASEKYFSTSGPVEFVGCPTFESILETVRDGAADFALLPLENTSAGSIEECYDLLAKTDLFLVGEEVLKVEHCLCAIEEVPLDCLRAIISHQKALEQCAVFLETMPHCRIERAGDTASGARRVKEDGDSTAAAIASAEAARRQGLRILKREISDRPDNFTRFVVVARARAEVDPRVLAKTSILFTARRSEALTRCLNVFAKHQINLTAVKSSPRPHSPWEYQYFVDFEGDLRETRVRGALEELAADSGMLKIFGSYQARTVEERMPVAIAVPEVRDPPTKVATSARTDRKSFTIASRESCPTDSVFRIRNVELGGSNPVMIAGPCSVESREQILECARIVRECGGHLLRGGCFKPRSSPYSFQGLGWQALDLLVEAGRRYDLPIVTEVMNAADLPRVAELADVLQVGARNMQNFSLLKELGSVDRPIILKRGMMSTIDEWLQAAEYILAHGNRQVILCERGIRTFETATRNTLDVAAVPVAREWSHLPVIVDPSHACGVRRWVAPLAEASLAAGANGIMIEIHPEPEKALSDGPQSLDFDQFRGLMTLWRQRIAAPK